MRPVLGLEAIDKPTAGCNADSWLADGVTTILKPGLMEEKLSLRLLKAICEISYFVSIRPDVHSAELIASVSDCLEALWQDGRLLGHVRHNLQHANLWLPILQACKTFLPSVLLSAPTLDNIQMIRLRELIDATIAIKIGESSIEDCIDVCTSASILLTADYLTELECFVDSFKSEVLSFGFVACDTPESQQFAGRVEVALRRFEAAKALCAKYPRRQPIL